jgi:hypothetical protein
MGCGASTQAVNNSYRIDVSPCCDTEADQEFAECEKHRIASDSGSEQSEPSTLRTWARQRFAVVNARFTHDINGDVDQFISNDAPSDVRGEKQRWIIAWLMSVPIDANSKDEPSPGPSRIPSWKTDDSKTISFDVAFDRTTSSNGLKTTSVQKSTEETLLHSVPQSPNVITTPMTPSTMA